MLVGEGSHPDRVKVYGPGVEKTGLKANEPTYFTVDCSEAGQGELIEETEAGWRKRMHFLNRKHTYCTSVQLN